MTELIEKSQAVEDSPTAEELSALQRYANAHGRNWRWFLAAAWESGADEKEIDGVALRLVRNRLGPSWLYSKRNQIKPDKA